MPERRKATRYPLGATGRLHRPGGATGTNVTVRVISMLGAEIEGAKELREGQRCELYLDWRDTHIGTQAQVVWINGGGKMGLRFLAPDKDTQQRLSELCRALREPPAPAPPEEPAQPVAPPTPVPEPTPAPPPRRERKRRRVPRYISEMRAHVSDPASGMTTKVKLTTLSVLGGCLEGLGLPEPGAQCELNTEWDGYPLRLPAEVVWKGKGDRAGLRFVALSAENEQTLRLICSNLRLQPMAPLPAEPE